MPWTVKQPKADLVLLAGPVLAIEDWMQRLAPLLGARTLVTDVGSTKAQIAVLGAKLYNQPARARFLPGHPMAGKESGGAAQAEASLFRGAMWLFTPQAGVATSEIEAEWRGWVAHRRAHDGPGRGAARWSWWRGCSHLPQMLSTALAALLEETFAGDHDAIAAIGGRALRETTRLGASPYSMWRDIALTNSEPIAAIARCDGAEAGASAGEPEDAGAEGRVSLANEFRARKS